MKVAQFSTFPYGGAATAARRLHEGLRENNVDSRLYYHRNDKERFEDSSFYQLSFSKPKYGVFTGAIQRRLDRRRQKEIYQQYNDHIALRPVGVETFSMARLPERTQLDWTSIDSDLVHLHWISFFADYPSFFGSIPNHVPIVWTLHDMNAFTGGCHYSNGCTRFEFGCGGCNQVTNSSRSDVSASTFKAKQSSLLQKDIHVVAPCDWIRELAMKSSIWPRETTFQTIRMGFDLNAFHPITKSDARCALGIAGDAVLIGFGADEVNSRRKGIQHLLPALSQLNAIQGTTKKIECVVFGSGEIEPAAGLPNVHHFGYVDSAEKQALIYSAADVVVVPSREDNQPQVGLEAMACGTPVVAFNAGGIPEYVRDGSTGLIAELGNEAHLAERIRWLVENEAPRLNMGKRARLMMEQEFELGKQTDCYQTLYENVGQSNRVARVA